MLQGGKEGIVGPQMPRKEQHCKAKGVKNAQSWRGVQKDKELNCPLELAQLLEALGRGSG